MLAVGPPVAVCIAAIAGAIWPVLTPAMPNTLLFAAIAQESLPLIADQYTVCILPVLHPVPLQPNSPQLPEDIQVSPVALVGFISGDPPPNIKSNIPIS